ncbi:L,D-transpeptidase family protein [Streptomyces amakusaensis]|uniref:L,D-transpeptidase family protein n=1 Tax=Streptomyces amakusaensis TaxID=67271 RepID=A0ABW0AGE5_9ACTN
MRTRRGTRQGPRRGTRRAATVRGVLAAVAVLAVTTGCTAQASDLRSAGAGSGVGGTPSATGAVSKPPPAPAPVLPPPPVSSSAPAPAATPSARPSVSASATTAAPARSAAPSTPPAPVLMSRGARSDQVRELQARLAQIGWFDDAPTGTYGPVTTAAVQGFQSRRGLPVTGATDTVTWRKLLGMTTEPTRAELTGETVNKPAVKLDPRCTTGRVMCVSKTTRTLSWVVDGEVRSTMDVRFGSEYTPTREGVFSVFLKSRDHVSTLYDTPMPYALFFSGGQAVHYSSDFAANGYSGASHGCVNVRDRAAVSALFAEVRNGDKVVVHW